MRKLTMVFCSAVVLWFAVPTALAQNTVDVLGGIQPTNMTGCPMNPKCIPATWSTTSNAGTDITSPITKYFVFDSNGGELATDFPPATSGNICLADTRDLTMTTLFAQIAANCQAAGGVALLLIRNTGVTAPSTIPVFTISTTDGDYLKTTSGFDAVTKKSNYQIRINVAVATPPFNPTGQHNCPNGQAVPAHVGAGTANYTPVESLCLPAGAGQAVEPSMTVDSQGTIYVESIRGVPAGLDLWRWNRARDGGPNADGTLPFKYEGQPDCGMFVGAFCQGSGLAPGGGDGDVAVNGPDPSNTFIPNLAVVSLAAAEVTASHSTNRADTFNTPNPGAAHIPLDDRMWINALDDAKHVYMEYHDFVSTSEILVQRSADGGQNYADVVLSPVVTDPLVQSAVGPPTGNIAGQIKVDRSRTASHGNLYQIFVGPDSVADNNNDPHFINTVYVGVASGVSLAAGATLSFTDHQIFTCGPGSKCPTGLGLGNLFPALAVDDFGNVYAVWSDNTDIYYSYSTTHGTSWSSAIKVTQGTTQAGMSNVFPWVAADANGHVAIAWYGADAGGDSNTQPSTTKWNVFVAETVNGHASTPAFTLSQATDQPNHKGSISTGGLTGSSDRTLADFFQIAIDPTNHLINIAFADNSSHAGTTAVTYFTRQRKATGGITGGCAGHQEDGEGDIRGEKGGDAHFRLHHDDCNEERDDEEFSDSGEGRDFHSTEVTSVTRDDVAHTVTIVGSGVDNGLPVAFKIVAVDSSLVPPGLFSIILSDGYTNSGPLLDGGITLY
jgi:PA domain